jgi:hypothetical protein
VSAAASGRAAAFARLSILLVVCSLLCVVQADANEVLVDKRTLQTNDLVTITVSLEGSFASLDAVEIPLRNLSLIGDPSVSSEFAWINGDVTRRKAFRYRARPIESGPAQVGPIVLNAPDGQRETLAAIALQVMADRASGSNDAAVVLRELVASGRDPLFVVAEVDKTNVFAGEPLLVTWWLYNAASVQEWQVVSIPKLVDFWSEERPRSEQAERVYVGDTIMQRIAVRRVTLFPLRSGTLRVGGLTIEAAVMRRIRRGPFAMYEGELVETTFTSAPIELAVKPLPPGPPVDAVGDLSLICTNPVQRNNGPVVLNVTLTGLGNVRAATPPHFETPIAGRVQLEGGEVSASRGETSFGMARQWRFLIFPAASGPLTIPPLTMRIFDPAKGARRDLQCSMSYVNASMARPAEAPPPEQADPMEERPRDWKWLAPAALVLGLLWLVVPRGRRAMRIRREARELVRGATAAEIRARVDERMRIDVREQSDRGDAYRALLSLLTAAERDRDIAVDAEDEIERRVRELLSAAR